MWLHLYKWAEERRAAAGICEMKIALALALAEEKDEMAEAACFSSGCDYVATWLGVCMAFLYFLGGLEVLTRHDGFLGVMHEFRS